MSEQGLQQRAGFLLSQIKANGSLAVSGALEGNWGRVSTAVGNVVRNGAWLAANERARASGDTALQSDLNATRTDTGGAVLAAGTNSIQFVTGLLSGSAVDAAGGGLAVAAYGIMAADRYIEQNILSKVFKRRAKRGLSHKNDRVLDRDDREQLVGYRARQRLLQEYVLNKIPGLILLARSITFISGGALALVGKNYGVVGQEILQLTEQVMTHGPQAIAKASAPETLGIAAAAFMTVAGYNFVSGSVKELRKQSTLFRNTPLRKIPGAIACDIAKMMGFGPKPKL